MDTRPGPGGDRDSNVTLNRSVSTPLSLQVTTFVVTAPRFLLVLDFHLVSGRPAHVPRPYPRLSPLQSSLTQTEIGVRDPSISLPHLSLCYFSLKTTRSQVDRCLSPTLPGPLPFGLSYSSYTRSNPLPGTPLSSPQTLHFYLVFVPNH